ncbi:CDP-alcohol phosphatidyltransferase family protein [Roseibium sp.]|uniref:CDP-alcohol phosphatidyltransferase family protein n=1 Tax=Roseibium sp. TaxID=1936156 RepID=UPI003A987C99
MFDARLRPLIDPPLNALAAPLAKTGVSATQITLAGFGLGAAACLAIACQVYWLGFLLICLNRLADGVDGAVARLSQRTDGGGYLDIVLDFFFYAGVPFAFALADPAGNALAAAALLFSFYANGSAFLAFAVMAEKRGLETTAQGRKSLYYLSGIAEGAETIALFLVMCTFPQGFVWLAWGFAMVCWLSAAARAISSAQALK